MTATINGQHFAQFAYFVVTYSIHCPALKIFRVLVEV